jgi:very-short-patch-repair endonuclease
MAISLLVYVMVGEEKKELRRKSRNLRNNMTRSEIILWSRIRSRQIDGYKFRRQYPILDFITDFYCHDLKLIIEVDGDVHTLPDIIDNDDYRDKMLRNNGYHVIHFTNHEIETDLNNSLSKIKLFISEILSSSLKGNRKPG